MVWNIPGGGTVEANVVWHMTARSLIRERANKTATTFMIGQCQRNIIPSEATISG